MTPQSPLAGLQRPGAASAPSMSQPGGGGGLNILNESSPMDGSGSAATGYASPDEGPFECDNCQFFQAPGTCNHPEVQNDPEVNGEVDPEGCCNKFVSAGKETQDEEHTEGAGPEAAPSKGGKGGAGFAGMKKSPKAPKKAGAAGPRGNLAESE